MLVRNGTVIPKIALAQSTMQMDWSKLELVVFAKDLPAAEGLVCLPSDNQLHELSLTRKGKVFKLNNDPLAGKVTWKIAQAENAR
jgi:alpha-D-xyloside xylohydrolase